MMSGCQSYHQNGNMVSRSCLVTILLINSIICANYMGKLFVLSDSLDICGNASPAVYDCCCDIPKIMAQIILKLQVGNGGNLHYVSHCFSYHCTVSNVFLDLDEYVNDIKQRAQVSAWTLESLKLDGSMRLLGN